MSEEEKEVKKIVRSLLLSAKHGLTVNELCSEYSAVTYKQLPYKRLGYSSAIDMVKDMPDVVRPMFLSGGVMILQGVADSSTAHISELVRKQRNNGANTRIVVPQDAPKPIKTVVIPNLIRSKILDLIVFYPNGLELALFEKAYFNQYGKKLMPSLLGFASTRKLFESCGDIISIKVIQGQVMVYPVESRSRGKVSPDNTNKFLWKKKIKPEIKPAIGIPETLIEEIIEVLKGFQNGCWSARFPFVFKNHHDKSFDIQSYGFTSVVEIMAKLPERIFISRPAPNGDWLLFAKGYENVPKTTDKLISQHSNYKLRNAAELDALIEIYLSYIIDPSTFWFQFIDSMDSLDELAEKLNIFYENRKADNLKIKPETAKPNQACCAKYEDGNWYRAVIKTVLPQDKAQVFYVDYGNDVDLNISSLRLLDKQFFTLPCQAIQAKLYGVMPDEGNVWSQAKKEKFFDLTNDQYLYGKVKAKNEVLVLELIDTSSEDDVYIAAELNPRKYTEKENKVKTKDLPPPTKELPSAESDYNNSSDSHSGSEQQQRLKDSEMETLQQYYLEYFNALQQVSKLSITNSTRTSPINSNVMSHTPVERKANTEVKKQLQSSSTPINTKSSNTELNNNNDNNISPILEHQCNLKIINISENFSLHVFRHNDQPYCSSAEISSLYWESDILRQMLRQKGVLDIQRTMLLQEDNQQLFSMLAKNNVVGVIQREIIRPFVSVYHLQHLPRIMKLFPTKYTGCERAIEAEVTKFESAPPQVYWLSKVSAAEEEKEKNQFKLQALKSKSKAAGFCFAKNALHRGCKSAHLRKRLLLGMMTNSSSSSSLADLREVEKDIEVLERLSLQQWVK